MERRNDARPAPAAEPLSGLDELARALRCLPGVGPKAAQRMALHLLQHDREGAVRLAHALQHAAQTVRHCERCNTFTEDALCALCRSTRRDPGAAVRGRDAGRPADGRADAMPTTASTSC